MTKDEMKELAEVIAEGVSKGVATIVSDLQRNTTVLQTRMDERCAAHLKLIEVVQAQSERNTNTLTNRVWMVAIGVPGTLGIIIAIYEFVTRH